ncbi:endonuclease domain-containing protein [Sphingomonas endolithica]|uniref:endonuclease domain-containing protein n=1 Tax=Sphingomonas endolithica TaxID=2972485 RepID=UPI0021AFDC0D|nr:endonuclease domain-containing protein [Sphingomonas sp. ZFBP2030]
MPQTDKLLLERAKSMRTIMTQPEREIWTALRGKRFENTKFVRQVVIGPYIADFVARSDKLILEIDGDTHTDAEQDTRRTSWLEAQGYRIIRFNNNDVMHNMESVLETLALALAAAPLPTLSPKGRGL